MFFHDLSENQLHFLEKWVINNYEFLKIFISYVFVKKSNFVFFLFFSVIFRFIENISSLYRGNIYFSEINKIKVFANFGLNETETLLRY